jgi:hypothetical protein
VTNPAKAPHLVLLRFSGELSTKARATRRQFVTQLLRNVRDALAAEGYQGEIERHHERVFVEVSSPDAIEALERVFGLQSLSPAERRPCASLSEIVVAGQPGSTWKTPRSPPTWRCTGVRPTSSPSGAQGGADSPSALASAP